MKKLLTIFLLFAASSVSAAVATVLFTAKKVTAQQGGVERPLNRGGSLEAGDSIITAAGAIARIRYLNGTLVTIGSDSNYKIIAYAPPQSDVVIDAELSKGSLESKTAGEKKREALKTPVVALAITGTTFKVYVRCKPTNNIDDCKITNVQNVEGEVKVGDTVLKPGDSVVATPTGVTPAPFPSEGNITLTAEMEAASSQPSETVKTNTTSKASTTTRSTKSAVKAKAASTTKAATSTRAATKVTVATGAGSVAGAAVTSESGAEENASTDSGATQVSLLATTIVVAGTTASSAQAVSVLDAEQAVLQVVSCYPNYNLPPIQ